MTCETCAGPGRTFRLIGTSESLCADCFVVAHPPAPSALGCLADLRTRRYRGFSGRCRGR